MKKLSVANGTYVNREGQTKTNWVQVGVIGTSQNGKEYMLIDPTINFAGFPREQGKDMVMVGMFEDTPQGQGGQGGQPQGGHYTQGGYVPPQGGQGHQGQHPPVEYFDANGNPLTLPNRG